MLQAADSKNEKQNYHVVAAFCSDHTHLFPISKQNKRRPKIRMRVFGGGVSQICGGGLFSVSFTG